MSVSAFDLAETISLLGSERADVSDIKTDFSKTHNVTFAVIYASKQESTCCCANDLMANALYRLLQLLLMSSGS